MAYRVDLTERAARNLRRICLTINAEDGAQASAWFNGRQCQASTNARPEAHPFLKAATFATCGRKGHRHRIIYAIVESNRVVTVLHIRRGARDAFTPDGPDDDE